MRYVAAALLSTLFAVLMTACGDRAAAPDPDSMHEPAVVSDDAAVKHGDVGAQPLPLRLAFMSGHVEAGLALFRAGAPEMAARHLLHPVSESYAEERAGLDALGFRPELFETVSEALEAGRSAEEIAPQLAAAEAHLAEIATRAGGDAAEIIAFLMDTVIDEYAEGVTDGVVTNGGEYQDAFGFTVVALQRVPGLPEASRAGVQAALETLLAAWPEAPVPPESATPVDEVSAAAEAVKALVAAAS